MSALADLKEVLVEVADQLDLPDFSPYRSIVEYGREFTPSTEIPEGLKRGEAKQCYNNATLSLLSQEIEQAKGGVPEGHERYLYCEGFVWSDKVPIPIQHAWLLDTATDRVVELTLQPSDEERAYVGIVFKTASVLLNLTMSQFRPGMLCNHFSKFFIERDGLDNHVWGYDDGC